MEIMLWVKLVKPESMSNAEFFEVWRQESVAVTAALEAGAIKHVWKVAGKYEVIAVMDVASGDDMDAAVHALPIWKLGFAHLVPEISWTPLASYRAWGAQLTELAKG